MAKNYYVQSLNSFRRIAINHLTTLKGKIWI